MNKNNLINHLSESNSPYLLQHQNNPVAWYEWCEEAFAVAKENEKLIFLSIGYSTCHWCHVMAHESFENDDVAQILNQHFVSIKVDREERPDIDKIYMDVCQAMTGSGGWPLTLVLTPEKIPIFAGTYFPRNSKFGRPGLTDILKILAQKWEQERESVLRQAREIGQALAQPPIPESAGLIPQILSAAAQNIARTFDRQYGGFGSAPKFPMGHLLLFLARTAERNHDQQLLAKVEKSFQAMYYGGLFDQVGFGFYRYSTDEKWMIPHFEKMLYDNALLILTAVELFRVTRNPLYGEVVDRVFTYLKRDLSNSDGAFFSAEDADSEGEEGKFYVFSAKEFIALAGADATWLQQYFGVSPEGNFEGANHLHIKQPPAEFCSLHGLDSAQFQQQVENLRLKLLKHRSQRIRPSLDDKVLTAWNGLMIMALAEAGNVFRRPEYIEAAVRAAEFVLHNLRGANSCLLRSWRQGRASIKGFLEDYAFFSGGLLALFRADSNPIWLEKALELHRYALNNFAGTDAGVYYESETEAEKLLTRPYNQYDGAMPSAVAQLALNAIAIGHLCADATQLEIAGKIVERAGLLIKEAPSGFAWHLTAYDLLVNPGDCLVVFAASKAQAQPFIDVFTAGHRPGAMVTVVTVEKSDEIFSLIPHLAAMKPKKLPAAVLCRGFSCQPEVTSPENLAEFLLI